MIHEATHEREADEIGDLEKEIERLRAALTKISEIRNQLYGPDWEEIEEARAIALMALAPQP